MEKFAVTVGHNRARRAVVINARRLRAEKVAARRAARRARNGAIGANRRVDARDVA